MWIPYETRRNYPTDFVVRYRFFAAEEGGRKHLPFQGYRGDFAIEDDFKGSNIDLRMIHPEFEDELGNIITDTTIQVPKSGRARMWVLFEESRPRHRNTLKVGMKGYFMEGPKKVGEAEIIEIIGLNSNPIKE
ncbi:hypothetical protein PASE110613_17805 [Paenibacillus sediminis]|uniref:Uncharacterized protein n=1 Tax=Paenibacillus sediminis TaxID=664909 RepID=A0ABS4H857_9BACL|nr:hypothetical protein [Paenibacillus sediminis]MBP1938666.1 hypothetical protein [Paenibacillus sediminis]